MAIKVQEIKWERAEPVNTTNATASSPVSSNCADIMFINITTDKVYLIDGIPLPPLSTMVDGCNAGEWNTHTYQVQGDAPTISGTLLLGLYVRRKKYGKIIEIN